MTTFNNPVFWKECNSEKRKQLLMRPFFLRSKEISSQVKHILNTVKLKGDKALNIFSYKYDKIKLNNFCVNQSEIIDSANHLSDELKQAMQKAVKNISIFHTKQNNNVVDVEIDKGLRCQQITRPIESVGLYIPNGSAPLFSTIFMLAIPAKIARCKRIVICSPPKIYNEVLYAAHLCGVKEIFQIGGAQAIAALAFGTETIKKVDKIFGPGNIYVTEAKKQVSKNINGPGIDILAGPSELLIIADTYANPEFIASDLLSQAEHDPHAQVILVTDCIVLPQKVIKALNQQLKTLNRANVIIKALTHSKIIIAYDISECIEISNQYGPEHLMIHTNHSRKLLPLIIRAGSIFLGPWSPISLGDYASGTNHVLPTYGHTSTFSGISVSDFQKRITVQEITTEGFINLSNTVQILAEAECLDAHKHSVTLRVNALRKNS